MLSILKAFLRLLFVLNRGLFRKCIHAVYIPLRNALGRASARRSSILFELFSDTEWLLETLRVDVEIQYPATDLRTTCDVHIGTLKGGTSIEKVVVKALRTPEKGLFHDRNETAASLTRKVVRECFVWSLVEHENICAFRGLGQLEEFELPVLVSVYVPHKCLAHISCHPERRLSVVLETASGMGYLHGIGIAHGDLKPDNIMINESWRVQIIDFGLSKFQYMSGFTTMQPGHRNPRYCAPELLRQERNERVIKPTFESDVFGFGMTMLELLSWDGEGSECMPYNHRTEIEVVALWIRLTEATLPVERPRLNRYPNVPSAFHGLLQRCWEEEPFNRLSMAAVVDDLRRLV